MFVTIDTLECRLCLPKNELRFSQKLKLSSPFIINLNNQSIFKRLLLHHKGEPRKIVTDKLRSYGAAHRDLMPETVRSTPQYKNNGLIQS